MHRGYCYAPWFHDHGDVAHIKFPLLTFKSRWNPFHFKEILKGILQGGKLVNMS